MESYAIDVTASGYASDISLEIVSKCHFKRLYHEALQSTLFSFCYRQYPPKIILLGFRIHKTSYSLVHNIRVLNGLLIMMIASTNN